MPDALGDVVRAAIKERTDANGRGNVLDVAATSQGRAARDTAAPSRTHNELRLGASV